MTEEMQGLALMIKAFGDGLFLLNIIAYLLSMALGALLMYIYLKIREQRKKRRKVWKFWWFNR